MLAIVLALVATGCFDFSALTECRGSTTWVCDDFERGSYADAWDVHQTGTVTGAVDAVHAHASKQALHVAGMPQTSAEWVLQWHQLPQDVGVHAFARAFVYLPAPTTNTLAIMTMIEPVSPYDGVRVLLNTSGGLTLHNGISGPDADTTAALPIGRWTCVEWEVDEGNSGMMNMWIDDMPAASVAGDTMPASRLGTVSVGLVYNSTVTTADPIDIWFDDVVLDAARITCRQ